MIKSKENNGLTGGHRYSSDIMQDYFQAVYGSGSPALKMITDEAGLIHVENLSCPWSGISKLATGGVCLFPSPIAILPFYQ